MTGLNLYAAQKLIKDFMVANIPWHVESGSVPDGEARYLDNGETVPYVVLRFSDMMPVGGGGSFGGARHGEYYSYVDALCVAPTDDEARELASLVNATLIGQRFENTGEMTTNFGGGSYAVPSGERLPAAFVAVTSFRFILNVQAVGSDYLTN